MSDRRLRVGPVLVAFCCAWFGCAVASIDRGITVDGLELAGFTGQPARQLGDCAFNQRERALAERLLTLELQRRPRLTCDTDLQAFARMRARDIASRGYFGHVTPENLGPNDLLRAQGFELPGYYSSGRGNTIEALVGGFEDVEDVLHRLLDSPDHRAHLLGEEDIFAEQDLFGIAYLREWDTPHVDHWVIIIARRARPEDPQFLCEPPPGGCRVLSGGATD